MLMGLGAKEFSASIAEIKKAVRLLGVEIGVYKESDSKEDSLVKLRNIVKLFK